MTGENGKRLRKFNVIDFLVIVLVLGVIAFCVWKFSGVGREFTREDITITYTVRVEGVDPQIYEQVRKYTPSTLIDMGAKLSGEVTAVEKRPHAVAAMGEGKDSYWIEDPYHIDLLFTVRATVSESGGVMLSEVGDQEVRLGIKYTVETEYFEMDGTVVAVD